MKKMSITAASRIYRATATRHGYIPRNSFAARAMSAAARNYRK